MIKRVAKVAHVVAWLLLYVAAVYRMVFMRVD